MNISAGEMRNFRVLVGFFSGFNRRDWSVKMKVDSSLKSLI
jgi:hypothetical protein